MSFGLLPKPPGATEPPTDIPQADIPLPSFGQIAKDVNAALTEQGFWKRQWEGWKHNVSEVFAIILATVFHWFAKLGAFWANTISRSEDKSAPAFQELTNASLRALFGVDVNVGGAGLGTGAAGVKSAAPTIGSALIQGMFTGLGGQAAGGLAPSKAGAERYLTKMMELSLQGWLEGWVFETLSLGSLEKFADLDDNLAQVLGLGRITSQIVSPAADILVGTPFRWHLNKLYRPNLLSPRIAVRALQRGRMTREQFHEELARQGYSDASIEALIPTETEHIGIGDLDYLVSRGLWTFEAAAQHLVDQGYSKPIAETLLRIVEDKRLDVYRREYAGEVTRRFIDGCIDAEAFRDNLARSGLPERELNMVRIVAGVRKELRCKQLTTSEMRDAVERGIVSLADFRRHLRDQGYSNDDARVLELLLVAKVTDKRQADAARTAIAKERAAEKAAREAEALKKRQAAAQQLEQREISLSQFERSVRTGVRTLDQYREFLRKHGFSLDDQATLAELLSAELDQAQASAARREELRRQAAVKRVNVSDLEAGVKAGLLSIDEYGRRLDEAGFAGEDLALMVNLLQSDLDSAAEAKRTREEARARLAERQVSLNDLERAVRIGLKSIDDYQAALEAAGFDEADQATLRGLLTAQLDADQAARDRKEASAAQAAKRELSLADFERAVRAGVRTIAEYRSALARAGFDQADIDALTKLLQLDIDHDVAVAKARAEAEKRATEKRIPLSDIERAVKLGVVAMSSYQDALKRAGIVPDDQQILSLSLLAELKQARDAAAKRAAAETTLKKRGLSLAEFEHSVRAGLRNLQEYAAFLAAEGFSASDAATLSQLLQLEVAQDQAARLKRQQASAELAGRRISLGDFERAVKDGIRTMQEYVTFLQREGFSAYDISTLVALLSAEIAVQ